jgi:hypothetical protein
VRAPLRATPCAPPLTTARGRTRTQYGLSASKIFTRRVASQAPLLAAGTGATGAGDGSGGSAAAPARASRDAPGGSDSIGGERRFSDDESGGGGESSDGDSSPSVSGDEGSGGAPGDGAAAAAPLVFKDFFCSELVRWRAASDPVL